MGMKHDGKAIPFNGNDSKSCLSFRVGFLLYELQYGAREKELLKSSRIRQKGSDSFPTRDALDKEPVGSFHESGMQWLIKEAGRSCGGRYHAAINLCSG